ncbi:sodium:proton antiporter [Porphyromonadaceae bacterium COT-184 OH4590]|nr:sodium:proton antiporter [Porphyromonadaceae bacterium COT-184 OH4590]MDO4726092.1 cation:proton antiporter [Porphyromonadaceae bacterium]
MEHSLTPLIADLGLILIVAAVVTLIFRKLKQPLVLGYIIAGFLVSPYSNIIPTVTDLHNVETLAEIGVIFLLFSLGLEFSFKKLIRVGASASITAIVEIVIISISGYCVGKALGWSTMNSMFLGGMLASSSTTIIIRAFDELGVKSRNYAKTVFGVLVVEDIVVILLMVLLSTIAVTQSVEGGELLFTVLKLGFFLILWFLLGIFVIPTLLKKTRHLLDDEGYLVLSIGLCLGMVIVATQAGFSAELGAFIMGSILAETLAAERIEHTFKPVKDLFGAIFFVSVGMMINPTVIVEYGIPVLIVVLLVIVGKFLATLVGALLSGQSLKHSVQVAMSMAQIGEFAFIVATLGMSLGVIDEFLFPIAVGASAITTFTTPYMIKYSEPMYRFIEKILPQKFVDKLNNYSVSSQVLGSQSEWRQILKGSTTTVFLNGIIVISIVLVSSYLVVPFIHNNFNNELSEWIAMAGTLVVASPFIWAVMYKKPNYVTLRELWDNPDFNNTQLSVLSASRLIIGTVLIVYLVNKFLDPIHTALVVPVTVIVIYFASKYIKRLYKVIERRFVTNLNDREAEESRKQESINNIKQRLRASPDIVSSAAWDAHITDLEVPQNAKYIGRTLGELDWRKKFLINVIYIKSGDNIIYSPGPDAKLMPHDHVGVFGTDEVIEAFKSEFLNEERPIYPDLDLDNIVVEKHFIDPDSNLIGVAIRSSNIRERSGGIVVAIERGGNRILSPSADLVFEADDLIWIVGEKHKLQVLK